MSKRRKSKKYSKSDSGNLMGVIIVILILVIGGGSMLALSSSSNAGSGASSTSLTGGQSTSSLESQVTALTQQVKNNPNDPTLHENLGTTLFNLANAYKQSNNPKASETFNKTIQVYNETVKLEPNSKETLGDLATAYFYTGQTDQAIATVQKALKIDPAFAPALINYGIYLADGKGNYAGAIEQWQKVPSGTPQYNDAQNFIQQYKQAATSKGPQIKQ